MKKALDFFDTHNEEIRKNYGKMVQLKDLMGSHINDFIREDIELNDDEKLLLINRALANLLSCYCRIVYEIPNEDEEKLNGLDKMKTYNDELKKGLK